MTFIPGIEFSAIHDIYDCHILGYNIDYKNENLLEVCRLIRRKRQRKIIQVLKYILSEYMVNILYEHTLRIRKMDATVFPFEALNLESNLRFIYWLSNSFCKKIFKFRV